MKFKNIIPFLSIAILILTSCKKEKYDTLVDSEGLSKEIRLLVPDSVLANLKRMGMPIFGGDRPPIINLGTTPISYLAEPFLIKASTIPGDAVVGRDFLVSFYNQHKKSLQISYDYRVRFINAASNLENGKGLGAYIVGKDSSFTVFAEIESVIAAQRARGLHVLSGRIRNNALAELHVAVVILDDFGDPLNVFIPVNKPRIWIDTDAVSPRQ
jgi:hypothetical protein